MAWWKKRTIIEEETREAIPDVSDIDQHIPVMGKQVREFQALKPFYSEEFQCSFRLGKIHKLRISDADHPDSDATKLKSLLPQWEAEGKIRIL